MVESLHREIIVRWDISTFSAFQRCNAISAARTVFCISMAMVMGPTPPGLGVILPAMG
jgi:hypothetical protein